MQSQILTVLSASAEPLTIRHVQEALGLRHVPVYEFEQLEKSGQIARVPNPPGQKFSVDARYVKS